LEVLIKQQNNNSHLLIWTLLCSILLHITFAVVVPKFKFDPISQEKQPLTIELVKPKAPEPEPVAIPEPPKPIEPEPIKPPPKKREVRPEPIKQPKKTETPEPLPAPVEVKPEPTPTAPPPVIAAAATPEAKPEFVAPPPPPPDPAPPKPEGPSQSEINAAKNAYRNQVQNELKQNQRYPRIAQQRGIQGDVGLEISIDKEGNVTNVKVVDSSGNDSLDNAAIAAVKRSNIKQYMKEILRGYVDKITVTVGFKLAG
jgi:periplasmic protein TonB